MNAIVSFPATKVATLSSSAILVELNIGCPTFTKRDKKTQEEVLIAKGARSKAADVNKILLPECKELDAVSKFAALTRTWHNGRTLPWSNKGPRLLPGPIMFDYKTQVNQYRQDFFTLRDEFLMAYPQAIQTAAFGTGGFFERSDYASVDDVAEKFSFNIHFSPLPESGDFRLDIGQQGLDELRSEYEANANRMLGGVMQEMWDRMHDSLTTLSNQFRIEQDGTKGKLYQATIDAALEMCDLLEKFNPTNDEELDKARRDLKMTLQGIDLAEVKKYPEVRKGVKTELDAILNKLNF